MDQPNLAVTKNQINQAVETIRPHVRRTPNLTVRHRRFGDLEVVFKLEYLQNTGTFKARGATNFLLSQPIGPEGVVAASGGNHGAAVAWAAGEQGHIANIFVPTNSTPAKVERIRSYGAIVHQQGSVFAEANEAAAAFAEAKSAPMIHAYNNPIVMAGAGTVAAELLDDAPDLGAIFVACGGGGLAGGIASYIGPDMPLLVCETESTATFARASSNGEPTTGPVGGVAADALGASILGDNPWAALAKANARSILVSDHATTEAQNWIWEEFRITVEPAAAVPVAALLADPGLVPSDQPVGVVLCGANVSLSL